MDNNDLQGKSVILFDGVCNLCQRVVQEIIKRDRQDQFRFASLQSEFGKNIISQYDVVEDSILLLKDDKVLSKSNAALEISKQLSGLYPLLSVFKIVPKNIRDKAYDYIAKHRYGWFGKSENCWLPSKSLSKKFID